MQVEDRVALLAPVVARRQPGVDFGPAVQPGQLHIAPRAQVTREGRVGDGQEVGGGELHPRILGAQETGSAPSAVADPHPSTPRGRH
ncbi:hypothetical protein [Ornithinimicrobium kibberense]|uniref:hypothetical protein n=1 Tax=Ornithinimicrobium kibberense TaxID=282060 RepID=UPI003615F103